MVLQRSLFALVLTGCATASLSAEPARYMTAQLIAESLSPAPGSTILVGLRMNPRPGWHGYWSNPGDAGFAPTVRWSAPDGVAFGPLLHPAPKLISAAGISSFVHESEHILLSRITISSDLELGTPIPVTAKASWAACTATMCVPLRGTFNLALTVGVGAKSADSTALTAATRKLPRRASGGTFKIDGKSVRLILSGAIRLDPRRVRFFPDDNDAFETAQGRVESGKSGIVIAGPARTHLGRSISGVITDGTAAYRLTFAREEPKLAVAQPGSPLRVEAVAPRPAPAQAAEKSESDNVDRERDGTPARRVWPWLLIAAALLAGAVVAVRQSAKLKRF